MENMPELTENAKGYIKALKDTLKENISYQIVKHLV